MSSGRRQFGIYENTKICWNPFIKKKSQFAINCRFRSFFVVQICTRPSCTCADLQKLCKDILFILVVALDLSQEMLKGNIQQLQLHYKESRSEKCKGRGCSNIFTAAPLRLKLERALTVHPNRDEALEQRFYFCPPKQFLANPPHQSNVKDPHFLQVGAFVILSEPMQIMHWEFQKFSCIVGFC